METIFGSNRNNPTKNLGMYFGNSLLNDGSMLVTDIVKSNFNNNWGKGKSLNVPKSIADMSKNDLLKMNMDDLGKKVVDEFLKKMPWELGQNAITKIGQRGFENKYNDYMESQQQNSYQSQPLYNQNINYSSQQDMKNSKDAQYKMLIQILSLKNEYNAKNNE